MSATLREIAYNPPCRENGGYGREEWAVLGSLGLCGGCHQWGADPQFEACNQTCRECKRTKEEILEFHGIIYLTDLLTPDIEI